MNIKEKIKIKLLDKVSLFLECRNYSKSKLLIGLEKSRGLKKRGKKKWCSNLAESMTSEELVIIFQHCIWNTNKVALS